MHGLTTQLIEVRRFDIGTAFITEITSAEVIGDDDEKIRLGFACFG
jgi:hypothetical protein